MKGAKPVISRPTKRADSVRARLEDPQEDPITYRPFLLCALLLASCGWLRPAPEPQPVERGETERLRAEVKALRAELDALRAEVDIAHDVVASPPPPGPRLPARRADFARLEGAVDAVAELTDAVDVDLELVEGQVMELQTRVAVAEAQVGSIEGLINNHAGLIDGLSADLGDLEDETDTLRALNGLVYVEGGRIVVDGVDMVFRPATNPDGRVRSTGPVVAPLPN